MIKAFKIALDPTPETEQMFYSHAGGRLDSLGRRINDKGLRLTWLINRLQEPFNDECVEWTFSNSNSRPRFQYQNQTFSVAQFVLEFFGKTKPSSPNDNALHSCDNGKCFNPNHLEWGSDADNAKQRDDRGRGSAGKRERHGSAKLDSDKVCVIKSRISSGESHASIANSFGVSRWTIGDIAAGRTWN